MKKYTYNKLVRDRIPEIIKNSGGQFEIKVISSKNKITSLLKKKMAEEVKEILKAKKENLVEELADMLQILISISEVGGFGFNAIKEKMLKKAKANGEFKKGIFLVWGTNPKGYGSKPNKQ